MAEPLHMWDLLSLMRIRADCQKRLETHYWLDRNRISQSLEEMALEDFMFRIDDEIQERRYDCYERLKF